MKKLLTLMLAFCFASSVFADKPYDCEIDGIYYKLNHNNKTATVKYKTYKNTPDYIGSVNIPSTITYKKQTFTVSTIGMYAFSSCEKLTSVVIPNAVTTIEDHAFYNCKSLTTVTIPNSVTFIGERAFSYCDALTSISVDPANIHYCSVDGVLFSYSKDILVRYPPRKQQKTYVIPNFVKTIGNSAFCDCDNLISVTIPNSVTTIGNDAFESCSGLTSVTIPTSVTTIREGAFSYCSQLKKVVVLSKNIKIGDNEKYPVFNGCNIDDFYYAYAVNPNLKYIGGEIRKFHGLLSNELFLLIPFSEFAQEYVESHINQWQKKGQFEKLSDWQKRVNAITRKQKAEMFLEEAQEQYLDVYSAQRSHFDIGDYDADNEVFLVNESKMGNLLVPVPISDAQYVQRNWSLCNAVPHYAFAGADNIVLQSIDFKFPNNKTYTYRSNQNLTYAQTDIQYNFEPIDIDIASVGNATSQPKGRHDIQQKKLIVGNSDVDTNIPQSGKTNDKIFVVIIANEDYDMVSPVPYAKNDGSIFRKYCIRTLGIPEKNIHIRENATLNNMRSELAWLNDVCDAYKGEASVIFYYAGHGIPDENDKSAYLLPVDGDGRYVQSGYKLDDLYNRLGSMPAVSVTAFMDACFSGSQRGNGMLASARGVALKVKSGVPQGNMVVFSAAQGDETAYPNNEQQHGMFTYYLLKKLQATGGDVTLKDLGDYITTNVSRQSVVLNSKSQTPCVTPSATVASDWQNWKLK